MQLELDAELEGDMESTREIFLMDKGFEGTDDEVRAFLQEKIVEDMSISEPIGDLSSEQSHKRLPHDLDTLILDTTFTISTVVGRYFTQASIRPGMFKSLIELRELDVHYLPDKAKLRDASCVLGMMTADRIREEQTDRVLLDDSRIYGPSQGLCPDEPFYNQPTVCFCTGFLIAEDVMLTARHCLEGQCIEDIRLIHGFEAISDDGRARLELPRENIYSVTGILDAGSLSEHDLVLLQLDRPATTRTVARLSSNGAVGSGTLLHVVGYPMGLPVKLARYGQSEDRGDPYFFYARIDAYQSNSGSPVFNSLTHEVEGILIGGIADFWSVGGCNRSSNCLGSQCLGEQVLRVSAFRDHLQKLIVH